MKRIFECFLACMLLLALTGEASALSRNVRIVVFGDSLTSGYRLQPEEAFPARLERKLKEVGFTNVEVINMSVANDKLSDGIERLHALELQRPDIVLLQLGMNDVLRGIQVNLIEKNLDIIAERLMKMGAYTIMLGVHAPPNMGYDYMMQIDSLYRDKAKHYHMPLYPFVLDGVVGQQNLNLADGVHPNPKGVDVMVSRIYPFLDTALRWKISALQYQEDYKNYQQQQTMPTQR